MNKIKNYYFTYGTWHRYPFQGGWTKIEAPSREIAIMLFRCYHPDYTEGLLNCSSVYSEETFRKTEMWSLGNLGKHEVEIITMQHWDIKKTPFDI